MDKSAIKREVEHLLRHRDFPSLVELCAANRQYWQEIRYRLYDLDEVLRWSAIEAAGKLMRQWRDAGNEERVRIYIRTLFWSLNEESGGIGWSSPQTIAEIIAQNPVLIDPYGSMMIACCIDEPALLKACLWGIGRIGGLIKEAVMAFQKEIMEVFATEDSEILGLAAWAAGEADFVPAAPVLLQLSNRNEVVTIYIEGRFCEKTLGKWAQEAIGKMESQGR
jgi:hypothetical protein